jgi:hypothetical protein
LVCKDSLKGIQRWTHYSLRLLNEVSDLGQRESDDDEKHRNEDFDNQALSITSVDEESLEEQC